MLLLSQQNDAFLKVFGMGIRVGLRMGICLEEVCLAKFVGGCAGNSVGPGNDLTQVHPLIYAPKRVKLNSS